MGNLCGKESKSDNFQGPGRTLGAAPPQPSKASIPAHVAPSNTEVANSKPKATPVVGGPGRTVGSASASGTEQGGDPRSAAAAAAEVRSLSLSLKFGLGEGEGEGKGDVEKGRGARWPKKPMMTSVWM